MLKIDFYILFQYVESVVATYMKIQKTVNSKQFKTWFSRGCFTSAQNIQRLAESLTSELSKGDTLTEKSLELWLQGSTLLSQLLFFVSMYLFSISHKEKGGISSEKSCKYCNEYLLWNLYYMEKFSSWQYVIIHILNVITHL